ncbi:lipocalin family protein [Lacinutrix salivirga]
MKYLDCKFLILKNTVKTIVLLSIIIVTTSCSKNPKPFIEHINGYWEIEAVKLANGEKREYTINQNIDFFEINDSLTGFRKKLSPTFNGTFEASNDLEALTLKIENDSLNIYYKTPYNTWKETVLRANKDHLELINENNNVYYYKRYIPINLN